MESGLLQSIVHRVRPLGFILAGLFVLGLDARLLAAQSDPVHIPKGATEEEVVELVGWPNGRAELSRREIWSYDGFTITFINDRVDAVSGKPIGRRIAPLPPRDARVPAKSSGAMPVSSLPKDPQPAFANPRPATPTPPLAQATPANEAFRGAMLKGFLWPVIIAGLMVALKLALRRRRFPQGEPSTRTGDVFPSMPRRTAATAPEDAILDLALLRSIEWKRFEELVAAIFELAAFRTEFTSTGPDGGIDLRLYHQHPEGKSRPVAYVQCKAFKNRFVNVMTVRELYGVMAADKVETGYLVTTSDFTPDALAFASGKPLHLLNGRQVVERFNAVPRVKQQEILRHVLRGDYTTPTCARCDIKLVLRSGKQPFWCCRNYPRCKSLIYAEREV